MRISTAFSFQRATQDVQEKLTEIGKLQTQIGSGKKLLRPSDGPTEASRAVDLNQAISQLDQFQRNRVFCQSTVRSSGYHTNECEQFTPACARSYDSGQQWFSD